MAFSDQLEALGQNLADLRNLGFEVTFHRCTGGDHPSAWLSLERPDCVAEVIVWESGEVNLRAGFRGGGQLFANQHRTLERPSELEAALRPLREAIGLHLSR